MKKEKNIYLNFSTSLLHCHDPSPGHYHLPSGTPVILSAPTFVPFQPLLPPVARKRNPKPYLLTASPALLQTFHLN